jgi:hypothetical protein
MGGVVLGGQVLQSDIEPRIVDSLVRIPT